MARAADRAYEAIRAAIADGEFEPGSRLLEEELADRVGVSRTPVREALRRLDSEGVVEFVPNRGAHVAAWEARDLKEIFDLRAVLEGFAARLAARSIDDESLAELAELADEMEELASKGSGRDLDAIAELNNQFHQVVVDAAGNRLLGQMIAGIVQVPLVHRTFHRYDDVGLARSMAHHRELITALEHRDVNWAGTVMRSHVYAARATLEDSLDEAAEPDPIGPVEE